MAEQFSQEDNSFTTTDFTTDSDDSNTFNTQENNASEEIADYKSHYLKEKSNWENKEAKYKEYEKRAQDWDKWYSYYVAPKYKDSKEFHSQLMGWLNTPQGQKQVSQQAQQTTQQISPQVANQAQEQFDAQYSQVANQAQREGRNISHEEINWLLQQRDAYYQQTMNSVYQKAVQDAIGHITKNVLPEHFDIYDKVSLLRSNKLGNNEEDYRKLISHMIDKNIKDPYVAYDQVYGERDRKKSMEKLREEIRKEESKKLREDMAKRDVHVLKGNGTFPAPTNSGNNSNASVEDLKEKTLQEMVGKYGSSIL